MSLYFQVVVPLSLSDAETLLLVGVPAMVVVMVGAVVSFVHEAEVAVVCQLPTLSLPSTQRMMEPSESEEMSSVMVVAMAVSEP